MTYRHAGLQQTYFHRQMVPSFSLVALISCIVLPGCGPSEPSEVSAATSGYLPSEKSKPNSAASKEQNPTVSPPEKSNAGPVTGAVSPNANERGQDGLTTAPAVPNFEPGKVDPRIATQDFMLLKLENLTDAKSLVQFLEKSTRALRELIAASRRGLATNDLVLDRGMELSRMKLTASESLGKIAATDDEKAAAALGKLEALSQMASFRDVISSDQLRELAATEANNPDARVAQQAKSIMLNLLSLDVDSNTAKASELIEQVELLLQGGASLSMSNLSAIAQALAVLDKKSERQPEIQEAALSLAKKTEEAFRDHSEAQVALAAWEIHAVRTKELRDFGNLLSPESKDLNNLEKAKEVIHALMSKINSPWTSFVLLRQAIDLEYAGHPLVAKEMITMAETQAGNLKNEEERNELIQSCKQFQKRLGILNNTLDMSSLVDLQGQPIDLKRYQGKVVLVDFWASWCGPCIQEIPNIEKVFAQKNKDGFEVISINIDEEQANIDAFFQSRKLPWTTYISRSTDPEAKGFNAPIAQAVGISAIPFIAIIGKDGKVADIHVRGSKLGPKVVELLAKE
ncbi:MAG: TlpA disulfide reductase family protein [Pirellula sp.]